MWTIYHVEKKGADKSKSGQYQMRTIYYVEKKGRTKADPDNIRPGQFIT